VLAIGADHGGFELKEQLKALLDELGVAYSDLGVHENTRVDYPDYAFAVATQVAEGTAERGILVCGTGIGMSIAANKVPGIRATLVHDEYTARMSRAHNDSNVLCLGGRVLGIEIARAAVQAWLETPFEGSRHQQRLQKIADAEHKG